MQREGITLNRLVIHPKLVAKYHVPYHASFANQATNKGCHIDRMSVLSRQLIVYRELLCLVQCPCKAYTAIHIPVPIHTDRADT